MEPNQVLQSDLNDLIFEGRNKDYGAYELRKHYNRRMTIALTAVGIVLGMSIVGKIVAQGSGPVTEGSSVIIHEKILEDYKEREDPPKLPPLPPPAAAPATEAPKTMVFNEPVIVQQTTVQDVPTIDDLQTAKIGDKNIDGPDFGDVLPVIQGVPGGTGVIQAPKPVDDNQIFVGVSIEARVDSKAWVRHLERHLAGPMDYAAAEGMQAGKYMVLVRFVVEKDGSVSQVTALSDPGYGLKEAAEKAVTKGPKWSPGEQNGTRVRSWHTQPITFSVQENQ